MAHQQLRRPWIVAFAGAALVASLIGPAGVEIAAAQEETAASRLENRIPSSDPASDYVNDRLDAAAAAAEAAAASVAAEPAVAESEEAAPEGSAETPAETPTDAAGAPPAETKSKGKDAAAAPAEDGAAPEGGDGTTASLSGSDVVVSSVGESNQVDKPGRRGKGKR